MAARTPHGRCQHTPSAEGIGGAARACSRIAGVSSRESLSSPPGFHLPPLTGLADGIEAVEGEPRVIEVTYHDTPDLRLARAGAALLDRGQAGRAVPLAP